MNSELKIFRAPCTCAKCAPTDRNAAARLASLTRMVTLAKAEKPVPPAKPVSPNRVIEYVRSLVPPPPDLNAAIREDRAKEKK